MPHRVNTEGDIGTAKVASDSYDVDNIFLTNEGWVYRHFKKADKSLFWDEIICAGEVDSALVIDTVANTPVGTIGEASPTFETTRGDGVQDIENAPGFGGGGGTPPAPITIGTITVNGASTATDGDTETYTATNSGTATGVSYSLASSEGGDVVSGMDVTFNGTGARTLTVTGTKSGATDSGTATGTKSVTVS